MTTTSTSIRLDRALRERVHAEAARRGETFTQAVSRFAEDYAAHRDLTGPARVALTVVMEAMADSQDPIHGWSGELVRSWLTGVLSTIHLPEDRQA
jgi:predicted DNA-binding ribbon-helix-helix protein